MKLDELKALYERNKLSDESYQEAVKLLIWLEGHLQQNYPESLIDTIHETQLDELIQSLVKNGQNNVNSFLVLLRYYHVCKRKDLYIHLTKYIGGIDVIENILSRLARLHGKVMQAEVMKGLELPALGTPPSQVPLFTAEFMNRLKARFTEIQMQEILTGNNHGVSEKAFIQDKLDYETSATLAEFLANFHQKKVAVLQTYCDQDKVWFEQEMTQEVVDYVKNNQELLSAILQGDKLYLTKIPYDTIQYLQATDPKMKGYFACHCPFAREAILQDNLPISPLWCHCSAGFEKFPFEVIFGKKLPIRILETVLQGDSRCRFEISLQDIDYKK